MRLDEKPDVVRLVRNLHRISRYSFEQVFPKFSLKRSQVTILKMVQEAKERNVRVNFKMIAQELGVKTATISPIINELAEMGYLCRQVDEEDRRVIYCDITDQAVQLMDQAHVQIESLLQEVLGVLTIEEQEEFIRLTDKVVMSINKEG